MIISMTTLGHKILMYVVGRDPLLKRSRFRKTPHAQHHEQSVVGDEEWDPYCAELVYAPPLEVDSSIPWRCQIDSESRKIEQGEQEYDDGCDRRDKCTR